MRITYDEYDTLEEYCENFKKQNENELIGTDKYFPIQFIWPTVEQLEAVNVADNFEEYFPYLFFWYTQKLDDQLKDNPEEYQEYKEAMKYIKKLVDSNIEFVED